MSDARDIQHGVNQRSRRRRRREAQVPGQQDAVRTRAKSCRRPRRRFTRAGRRILARKAPTAAHRTAQQAERAKPDTPIARHGDSGHGYRTSFALAEWLCRPLIESIRRVSLNHVIVLGEARLRRILRNYAGLIAIVLECIGLCKRMRRSLVHFSDPAP